MRDLVKALTSASWRFPMLGAAQLAKVITLPIIRMLPNEHSRVKSLTAAAEQQIDKAFQGTIRVGDDVQRKSVDLMFDLFTLKPLLDTLQESTGIGETPGAGCQSSPELGFLNALLRAGPATTSTTLVVMAMLYSNLNRQAEGIESFESYLNRYRGQLLPRETSVYLSCLALMRAGRAQQLPMWQLPGLIDLIQRARSDMNEAKELTKSEPDFSENNEKLIARWVSGLLQAQLPWPFGHRGVAFEDLNWCEKTITENIERKSNAFQFLREVYYNLALLYRNSGENDRAQKYLALSRYENFDRKKILIATFYSASANGFRVSVKHITETIPRKVFTVSGFDMSEFNFIVSEDGKQLFAIDMGSREDTAEGAYRYFEDYYLEKYEKEPGITGVPKLTKVFVSHVHWDHIGGHPFFKRLNEDVEFYSRHNYREEQDLAEKQPPPFKWYMGVTFKPENVSNYVATNKVEEDIELIAGGTKIQLILPPCGGGETVDGMLIYLPERRVLYGGDFIVPWVGTPYTAMEGNVDSFLNTMDLITSLDPPPEHILYGHEALTKFVGTVDVLSKLRPHLKWLKDETLKQIYANKNRPEIQLMNLYPTEILDPSQAAVQLPYLIWRETFINRIYSQTVGYWGPQLEGVDYLSAKELGAILTEYMKLSEKDLATGIDKMIRAGDHELAGQTVDWALTQYPDSARLKQVREDAFLKLKEKWQLLIPFKFVMYSEHIDNPTRQLE